MLRQIETIFRDVAEAVNAAAAERGQLERSRVPADQARAHALREWEGRIFDRRLVYAQGRVDYGGGLLFDLKMLHRYTEASESPIGSAMRNTAQELQTRWQAIKATRP